MIFDNVEVKVQGGIGELPKMAKARQYFERNCLNEKDKVSQIKCGIASIQGPLDKKRIALTVGSRGIHGLKEIIYQIICELKERGALPFIVPAMGSHGGATSEGQRHVIESYGLSEEHMGVPVYDSMEVEDLGEVENTSGLHVYCQKDAYDSDGIIVINKIKPHADFKGRVESGLCKMMVIGLGKHVGATELHKYGFARMPGLLEPAAEHFLKKAPVILGVGILENPYDELMQLEFIKPEQILAREAELLKTAKKNIAKINISDIDVLIIDKIGKDISGEGMDPNVTGRPGSYLNEGFAAPNIQKVVVLGVTDISNGNGVGIGMADVTTLDLVKKLDFGQIYTNAVTSTLLGPARLPLVMKNDRLAIEIALRVCNGVGPGEAKIVWIKDTLHLDEICVSAPLLKEIEAREDIEIVSDFFELDFTEEGKIITV